MRNLLAIAIFAMALGCGRKSPANYSTAVSGATAEAPSASTEADALWEQRVDAAKLEESLVAYEKVLATDPGNRHALQQLTRGWYFYGDAFSDVLDVKLERWAKSIGFGARCLALNPEVARLIADGKKEKDAAASAVKEDVPCLYWTSTALGKWGKAQGLGTTLKHLDTVKAYMTKVDELDPTFFNHGPARYWGAYYSALPSIAGRDTEMSKKKLEESLAGSPNYLGTKVIRAEFWAVATQDAATFESDLQAVIAADPTLVADCVPENTMEQEKAKKLLARKSDLFAN